MVQEAIRPYLRRKNSQALILRGIGRNAEDEITIHSSHTTKQEQTGLFQIER